MKLDPKSVAQLTKGLGALLICWQASNFDLNYRSILGAVIVAYFAGSNTKPKADA